MEEHNSHETPRKSKRIVKYLMLGISVLTIVSALTIPWSLFTPKETIVSLLGLLFINAFLLWSYFILFVWRQRVFEYLERKHNLKIVWNTGGSFNVVGDVSIMIKLTVSMLIFSYFIFGMVGPLFLCIGGLILFGF